MTDIEVVFASGRPDAFEYPGGDTVQLEETRAALRDRGVTVRTVEDGEDLTGVEDADILHVFNLPYSQRMQDLVRTGREKGLSIAVSTVYWDFSHSLLLRAFSLRLGVDPTRLLKPLVPAMYPVFHRLRTILRSDSAFGLSRRRLNSIVEDADVLLPNSAAELCKLAAWLGRNPDTLAQRARVVPYAVDTDTFGLDDEAGDRAAEAYGVDNFVLEVGKLSPNKNQLALLEATRGLDRDLVIVGQGESAYAERVRDRAARRDDVTYIEHAPHEELAALYNAADVHALPSFRDSPGLVSLEAGACGCDLVVSRPTFCPVEEYFGNVAHRCDPYDQSSIRNALIRALESDRNTPEFRRRIQEEFTWDRVGQVTLEAYEEIY